MTKKGLEDLLKHAAELKDGAYQLDSGTSNGMLISAGGAMVTVENVVKMKLGAGYVDAETKKGERYLVDLACVIGVKLGTPPVEGAGFV